MYHLNADFEVNQLVVEKTKTREEILEAGYVEELYTDQRIEEMVL